MDHVDEDEYIAVYGAREHNLKNIDLRIPRNALVVITGLSGSGKSSLAFDTIHAEGQRRYMETFSAYARRFLGGMERPDVDKITGLGPSISIEQKTTNRNPRSTVGTITEIYDFFRLLYARAGVARSYLTGEAMVRYTDEQVLELLQQDFAGRQVSLLAPVVKARKGNYKELFEAACKRGFDSARVDGEVVDITRGMAVDRYKNHDIEIVIDNLTVGSDPRRLKSSVATAMKNGKGIIMVKEAGAGEVKYYSRHLMCPTTGMSYRDPAPHNFSFNTPQGACPKCKGLGYEQSIDMEKIIPDPALSIHGGGIQPLGKYKDTMIFQQVEAILRKHHATLRQPIRELPEEALSDILHGYPGQLYVEASRVQGITSRYLTSYGGILKYIAMQEEYEGSRRANKWAGQFISTRTCDLCHGQRLDRKSVV
jgi:excinuclease ABC subunit A